MLAASASRRRRAMIVRCHRRDSSSSLIPAAPVPAAVPARRAPDGPAPGPREPGSPPVVAEPSGAAFLVPSAGEGWGSLRPQIALVHRATGTTHVRRFGGPQVTLGSRGGHLVVPDPSLAERHLVMQALRGGLLLLAATPGGIDVGGHARDAAVLRPGGKVRVGDFHLLLRHVGPNPPGLGAPRARYFPTSDQDPEPDAEPDAAGLTILSERSRDGGGVRLCPARPVLLVGGRPGAGVHLGDPAAESAHALLLWANDGPWVVDLRSGSGTTLDGRPVRRAALSPGDELRFGSETVRLES